MKSVTIRIKTNFFFLMKKNITSPNSYQYEPIHIKMNGKYRKNFFSIFHNKYY